jgi:hypothetical protein
MTKVSLHRFSFAFVQPARVWVASHKVLSTFMVAVLLGLSWYGYSAATSTTGQVRYVVGTV